MDSRLYTRLAKLEGRAYGGRKRPVGLAGAVIHGPVAMITIGERVETVTRLRDESAASFRERVKGIVELKAERVAIFTQREFDRAVKEARESI